MRNETSTLLLQEKGLKVTLSRRTILTTFLNSHHPLSIKEIKKKLPTMDEVTIYRNLEQLTAAAIISRIFISKDRSYFERVRTHHHHIVCTDCGQIEDVNNCIMPKAVVVLKKLKNFNSITAHSLEFFGLCKICHDKK